MGDPPGAPERRTPIRVATSRSSCAATSPTRNPSVSPGDCQDAKARPPDLTTLGRVTTDFAGFRDAAFAMAVQPNGDIVAAGLRLTSNSLDRSDFAQARYLGR